MVAIKNWMARGRYKSVGIGVFGLLFQVVSWFILFGVMASNVGNQSVTTLTSIIALIWFFFPLTSLLGIAAGIVYQRRHGRDFFAVVGILFNLLWLLALVFVFFLVFVVGVTA